MPPRKPFPILGKRTVTIADWVKFLLLLLAWSISATMAPAANHPFFEIQVVDEHTGRGVPLVTLETTNSVRYVTDSAGRIAFQEPGLFGQPVWFDVRSHGYEHAADGFGMRGVRLQVEQGGKAQVVVHRKSLAERLYRITGEGIYRDSILLGHAAPIKQPLLNAQVMGSDSTLNVVHDGKIYWFWGDTTWPRYPLGNFHTPGAISRLPSAGGLDPVDGVDLDYFIDENGFAAPTAKMPGDGPTWIDGVASLPDQNGKSHIFMAYAKIDPPLATAGRGLARFNEETNRFEHLRDVPVDRPAGPEGHPLQFESGEKTWLYFATPFTLSRIPASAGSYQRIEDYESLTCLKPGSTLENPQIDRDGQGRVRYSWKRGVPSLAHDVGQHLIQQGDLTEQEVFRLYDAATGTPIVAHRGSVSWNAYRKRWIMIFGQLGGKSSMIGEIWYAEADSPAGPWTYAVQIATHDRYDFYNPKHHPMFDQRDGRTIYFEGTYTNTFSGNPERTPRYNYNQIMYRLALDDPRLALPVPIHDAVNTNNATSSEIAFLALDRPGMNSMPLYRATENGHALYQSEPPQPDSQPAFHALPLDAENPATEPLFQLKNPRTGAILYRGESQPIPPGFEKTTPPLCRIWKNPNTYILTP